MSDKRHVEERRQMTPSTNRARVIQTASGGWRRTVAFGSPYHVARAPMPSTVPHRLPTAFSTVRGVLVTPGVYRTVRHGPLSRGGVGLCRYGGGPPSSDSSWFQRAY